VSVPRCQGVSVPEQYLEKLTYSMEFIRGKQEALQEHTHTLHSEAPTVITLILEN